MNFNLSVVWVDGNEWRVCLPNGSYIPFKSPQDLMNQSINITDLITKGIRNKRDSLSEWLNLDDDIPF